jgi:predicted glycoside hydrolase/deacetylase ChbG (UPF0249 family)
MKKTVGLLAVLATLLWASPGLSETNYAERLGWGPDDRVLIIHCDDAGMSLASNRGAMEALDFGLVTSASVMMPCPWVPGFAKYVKDHPDVDVGLHLTMTSEYDWYRWMPVAGKAAVPGLADEQGCLWDNVRLVVQHASPDEIEIEIRAQIDRAETMGMPITHLDSHMGTLFATPEFLQRLVKVGIEKGIPVLLPANIGRSGRDNERARLIRGIVDQAWAAGLPVIDYIHGDSYDWKTTDKLAHFTKAMSELKPGITEMIIHCTKPDDVIGVINGNRDHLYGDYTSMISPDLKKVIEEEGIILTTWRELKERRLRVKE